MMNTMKMKTSASLPQYPLHLCLVTMADGIFSPDDILHHSLVIMGMNEEIQQGLGVNVINELFRSSYGSTPLVYASIWGDLLNTDVKSARIPKAERNLKGLKHFLIALHFLWVNPKNRRLIHVLFYPIGEKETYGINIWKWVGRISALLPTKVHWQDRFDDQMQNLHPDDRWKCVPMNCSHFTDSHIHTILGMLL